MRTVLSCIALFMLLSAPIYSADATPVEAKVDKALATEEHPHEFYLDAGVSALLFNPPERKGGPLYDGDGSGRNDLKNLTSFEPNSLAVYPRLAFGYEFAKEATPSVLGEDLQAEFSAAFFQTDASETEPMVLPLRHAGATDDAALHWG